MAAGWRDVLALTVRWMETRVMARGGRGIIVKAEDRSVGVKAEGRGIIVKAEGRTHTVDEGA